MKKLFNLFACVFAVACVSVSCTKDEEKAIVGEWEATKVHYVYKEDGTVVEEGEEFFTEVSKMTLIINDDSTVKLVGTYDNESILVTGTWVYANDKLIITGSEGNGEDTITATIDVVSVSKKELVLEYVEEDVYNGVKEEYISTIYFTGK